MKGRLPRISWLEAEPARVDLERLDMARLAPEMAWCDGPSGGWSGYAPLWPVDRAQPAGLGALVEDRRLRVDVEYPQAYPAVEPRLYPVEPHPTMGQRTDHAWHVNGNGSLCLLQTAEAWTGRETAAALVIKASGWFIEYLLMERGDIKAMTLTGIGSDTSLDALIDELCGHEH